jgi:hypothetical protein
MKVAHLCGLTIVVLLSAGCGGEPFRHVPVSGKVTYEDGSPIPVDGLSVAFHSQTPPVDAKTYPRPGMAAVDRATGTLGSVTSHKFNDGLVQGKHKVVLMVSVGSLPPSIVPPEYGDLAKTPLEVDTASQPFHLKVRKPSK